MLTKRREKGKTKLFFSFSLVLLGILRGKEREGEIERETSLREEEEKKEKKKKEEGRRRRLNFNLQSDFSSFLRF